MASEKNESGKTAPKKAMGAFRISQSILDNLKEVARSTGIPPSTIVARCLEENKVREVTKAHLETSLSNLAGK